VPLPSSTARATRLVADVGGTNTRLALFDPLTQELRTRRNYINRDHGTFEEIIDGWVHDLDEPLPKECCLAVAAPAPFKDQVTMLNIDWSFSLQGLVERFSFAQLRCINDFEGNAYALPHLSAQSLVTIHRGMVVPGGKLATIGPGTGLGGATLDITSSVPSACASEPGHMGLAAATELELALFSYLQPHYGEIYAELLLSGPGLQRLYQSLAAVQGQKVSQLTSEEISAKALTNECALCKLALNTFCALLGSVCGDFVLANGAYGGLYLAGGVIPQLIEFLRESPFLQRFQDKGMMCDHLTRVPLYVITDETAGLQGAAHSPL
jgi:glucokinase